ncbi:trimeric intracellular cation channel family protein [Novosphingobium lentum]|uniref:trimeric intracellular cation channel family protein n=1 Tax=Novosphingobium lentum TaxID=145287 RepID=UPI00082A8C63|nr:trimeric intracellular cation channel family protein [Novosphingobium lentum]
MSAAALPAILPHALPLALPAIVNVVDLAGIAVFALTGALLAARLRQTFVTCAFFALVTGVGGGSVRDLLIGAPVFWVRDPWVAPVCLATALVAWFSPRRWWAVDDETYGLLDWADALGLAAYAVLGTAKALGYGVAPVPAMLMGVITGCVGGIIRDVLAGRPSILMRPELYVTAAALSAGLFAGGFALGLPRGLVWPVAALAGFALRGAAIRWRLALPAFGGGG